MDFRIVSEAQTREFRSLIELSLIESPLTFSDSPREVGSFADADFTAKLRTIGDTPESFVLGAFDPGLIAMLAFKRDTREKATHKSTLYSVYVHPDHRERGIGSGLMDEVEKRAKQMSGLEQIHVWVMLSENSAIDFYLRRGYQSQGIVHKDLKVGGRYIDCEYLVLYLE